MLKPIYGEIWDEKDGRLTQHQLRDAAFAKLDPADYGDAAHEAMLADAYAFLISKRGQKPPKKAGKATASASGGRTGAARKSAGQANSARSSKRKLLRDKYPMLKGSYSVAFGIRKNLESMTAEDCRAAARRNRSLAEGNIRTAEWLEGLSEELINRGVGQVQNLPETVLDEFQESKS